MSSAQLLFIVAPNKSNSLETGEFHTLLSSHTSWATLFQPTLVGMIQLWYWIESAGLQLSVRLQCLQIN